MMAKRKLINDYLAISAVIGVILMVAITVAIGAVTFVYFSGLGGSPQEEKENAAIAVIADNGKIKITLVKAGQNMPNSGYEFSTAVTIRCNGRELDESNFFAGNTGWELGESLFIGDATPTLDDNGGDVTALTAGDYSVTVTLIKTVIYEDTVKVI
jgi:FlaG/FlaF family flagellin (archaellin)